MAHQIGDRVYKPIDTQEKCDEYASLASWCNDNNAVMEERDEYYEAVAIPEPQIEQVKHAKRRENDAACAAARATQAFSVVIDGTELAFLTNPQTASDLQNAYLSVSLGQTVPWVDERGVNFVFTSQAQVASVMSVLNPMVSSVYQIWSDYEAEISLATTVSEVNAIVIDYHVNTLDNV